MNIWERFLMKTLLSLSADIYVSRDSDFNTAVSKVDGPKEGEMHILKSAFDYLRESLLSSLVQFVIMLGVACYTIFVLVTAQQMTTALILGSVTIFMCLFFYRYVIIKLRMAGHFLYLTLKVGVEAKQLDSSEAKDKTFIRIFENIGVVIVKDD